MSPTSTLASGTTDYAGLIFSSKNRLLEFSSFAHAQELEYILQYKGDLLIYCPNWNTSESKERLVILLLEHRPEVCPSKLGYVVRLFHTF